MLNEPRDFLGNILAILFERELQSEKWRNEIINWDMSVILDTDYYPVTIHFSNGIRVEPGIVETPTLILQMTVSTIVSLARAELSPIRGLIQGKLRMKGMLRHPVATVRFYRLMMAALRGQ